MFIPTDVINANLVIKSIPELACFSTFGELLAALPKYLGVEVPASVSNVIVSNAQPSSSQTTSLWLRLSNSGTFIGLYVFADSGWQPIYPISLLSGDIATQIQWFYSSTGTTPKGWMQVSMSDPNIDPLVVSALTPQFVLDPTSSFYLYFAAYFVGF